MENERKDDNKINEFVSNEEFTLEEEFLNDIHSENLEANSSSLSIEYTRKSRTFQFFDRHQLSIISSRSEEESDEESKKLSISFFLSEK